jgi:uncharacterized protein with GYD domain
MASRTRSGLADSGDVEAVIIAALNLDWLNQLASDLQLPAGTVFTVIDHSGVEVNHSYATAGSYTVILTVTDNGSQSARAIHEVEVSDVTL